MFKVVYLDIVSIKASIAPWRGVLFRVPYDLKILEPHMCMLPLKLEP
jgi:hypothetical protein